MVQTTLKRSGMDHTAFNLQRTPCLPLPRKRSPDGASSECGGEHLIAAHYSFIDPERMKGWVGLVPVCGRLVCKPRPQASIRGRVYLRPGFYSRIYGTFRSLAKKTCNFLVPVSRQTLWSVNMQATISSNTCESVSVCDDVEFVSLSNLVTTTVIVMRGTATESRLPPVTVTRVPPLCTQAVVD